MASDSSIIFNFQRTPNFIDNMNQVGCFNVREMDGTTKNYRFELVSDCPERIEDCIFTDGSLKRNAVKVIRDLNDDEFGRVPLNFANGVGNNRTISLGASAVTLDVGDIEVNLKGIFLIDENTDYVLAYSILTRTVPLSNEVVLPCNGMVWNIRNEV